jgi:hypothetical protein
MSTSEINSQYFKYIRSWTIATLNRIKPENSAQRPGKKYNSFLWLAGHLLWTEEKLIANPLGLKRKFEGIKLEDFAINTKPSDVIKYKRKFADILSYLAYSEHEVSELILCTKEKDWSGKWKGELAKWFPDRMTAVKHCIIHESTHVGQMWILWKMIK